MTPQTERPTEGCFTALWVANNIMWSATYIYDDQGDLYRYNYEDNSWYLDNHLPLNSKYFINPTTESYNKALLKRIKNDN